MAQVSGRARGLRPVPATGRTTARYTPPRRRRWAGVVLPGHRAELRAAGARQKAARRAGRGKLQRATGIG